MKLFIINTGHGLSKEELAVRVNRMKGIADADTQISMECLENSTDCKYGNGGKPIDGLRFI